MTYPKDSSRDLEKVTIIIFSRQRQFALEKTMAYLAKYPMKIVVLDGSKSPLSLGTLHSHIKYIHSPNSINSRRLEAIKWLSTPFAAILSDDEIFLPSGLEKMVKTLEQDSRLSCVGGSTLSIWKFGWKVCGFWPYRMATGKEITGDNLRQRVQNITDPKNILGVGFMYYNLFRTTILIDLLKQISEMNEKFNIDCTEQLSIVFALLNGNVKYEKELYWLRNWNRLPRSSPGVDRARSISAWWRDETSETERIDFINELGRKVFLPADQAFLEEIWSSLLEVNRPLEIRGLLAGRVKYLGALPHSIYKLLGRVSFLWKSIFMPKRIPKGFESVLKEMKSQNVNFQIEEVKLAVKVVAEI